MGMTPVRGERVISVRMRKELYDRVQELAR